MSILLEVLAGGVINASGDPLDSGKVFVYEVGTTTPVNVFQDAETTILHSNPLTLSTAGKAEAYVLQDVRLVIEDADGNLIDDLDAIGSISEFQSTLTIGDNPNDTVIFNSSILGNLVPIVDNLYNIGAALLRWANGYFVNLFATTLNGIKLATDLIVSGGANNPNWISNVGFTYETGTFTITDVNGDPLSADNPAFITMPSTTPGELVSIKVSAPASFDDFTGSSDLLNFFFGHDVAASSTVDEYFYLYQANVNNSENNGSDGNSCFFITKSTINTTPDDETLIGTTTAVPATDAIENIMLLGDFTPATYVEKPCVLLIRFRMRFNKDDADWTVQALDNFDGLVKLNEALTLFNNNGEFNYSDVSNAAANAFRNATSKSTGNSATLGNVAISNSSGTVSTTSGTFVNVTNLSVTIVTRGNPVKLYLLTTASNGYVRAFATDNGFAQSYVRYLRAGVTTVCQFELTVQSQSTSGTLDPEIRVPPGAFLSIDESAPAGSNTYTCQYSVLSSAGVSSIQFVNVKLVAEEMI